MGHRASNTFAKLTVCALINDLKKKFRKKLYVTIPQWSEVFQNMSHLRSGWNRAKCGLQLNDPIDWFKLCLNQPTIKVAHNLSNTFWFLKLKTLFWAYFGGCLLPWIPYGVLLAVVIRMQQISCFCSESSETELFFWVSSGNNINEVLPDVDLGFLVEYY